MYLIIQKCEMGHIFVSGSWQFEIGDFSFASIFCQSQSTWNKNNILLWLFVITCEVFPQFTFNFVQHLLTLTCQVWKSKFSGTVLSAKAAASKAIISTKKINMSDNIRGSEGSLKNESLGKIELVLEISSYFLPCLEVLYFFVATERLQTKLKKEKIKEPLQIKIFLNKVSQSKKVLINWS